MTDKRLMDCKQIQEEYGITRWAAEAIMRHLTKVKIDGFKKVYVKRVDVEEYMAEREVA